MVRGERLSFLVGVCPIHGHVLPLLALARELIDRGHRVRVLTGRNYRDRVRDAGAGFVPLPEEADYDDTDWEASFPGGRATKKGLAGIRESVLAVFLEPAPAQHRAAREAIGADHTDVLLCDPLFFGGTAVAREPARTRPLVVSCGLNPLGLPEQGAPPFGLGLRPMTGPFGRVRDGAARVVFNTLLARPVERAAREILDPLFGDAPRKGPVTDLAFGVDHVAQFVTPSLDYPELPVPGYARHYGPLTSSGGSGAPFPPWWEELDPRVSVVHVTQGTVANRDPGELLIPTMEALADEPVLVVATLGGRSAQTLGSYTPPANARVASYLPYDALLPLTSVMVTNGGFGGVQQALAHGIPVIAVGAGQDKPEGIARLAHSGAGLGLNRSRAPRRWMRSAVRRLLDEPVFVETAGRIRNEIAETSGLEGFLHEVRAYLDRKAAQ